MSVRSEGWQFVEWHVLTMILCPYHFASPVYHITKDGWTKVFGDDVGELHYKYYPKPTMN